jgi:hypothetical protein
MDPEEARLIDKHHRRIRWLKRLLRLMPRRANVHRYPGLKWVSGFARERMYLWSFRYRAVAPALYAGTILSLLPIFGIQIPIAFLLALLLRANLPVFVGLQFITNWFTVVPIYYICYQIGRFSLKLVDIHVDALTMEELRVVMEHFASHQWAANGRFLLHVVGITSLGSLILGSFLGTVFDQIYKFMAWRASITWERIRVIRAERQRRLKLASQSRKPRIFPKGKRSRRR